MAKAAGSAGGPDSWFDRAVRRSLRLEEEDKILEAAAACKRDLQVKMGPNAGHIVTSKPLPAYPEPKRNKAHWDYLMDEMCWLAKEFQKERKWKQNQSRKFARLVERSKLDVESRRLKRAAREHQMIRKKASDLSKMVMVWWSKIERIVVHKRQYEIEKIEKERLDRRLDKLVSKTERCSKNLAARVGNIMPSAGADNAEANQPNQAKSAKRVTFLDEALPLDDARGGGGASPQLERMFKDEDGDHDYDLFAEEEDEVDDERTMIEEERAAAREGDVHKKSREELDALKHESEVPIEKILREYYGHGAGSDDDAGDADAGPSTNGDGAGPSTSTHVNGTTSTSHDDDVSEGSRTHPLGADGRGPRGAREDEDAMSEEIEMTFRNERNDGEYMASESEEDDERTFAEEEALARREGASKAKEAQEIAALQDEMEIPLEDILARYRGASESVAAEAAPGPSHEQPAGAKEGVKAGAGQVALATRKRKGGHADHEDHGAEPKRAHGGSEPSHTRTRTRSRSRSGVEDGGAGDGFEPPFLLKYSLRSYQTVGLQWLSALGEKAMNGILADEMGLGKTIQTIALLAHLACAHGYWGPHLIVVPTSVMLNWEMEFKKWCPAFKILTYYGSAKERHQKRQGWSKLNSFHVCITTYTLILQDKNMFRRKKWDYLILDEAHMIKNWQSQRWQTLLRFHSRRRILLTGTPLQNNLMELWSLMHFLMPRIFESHDEFKEWFNNPLTSVVEGQSSLSTQLVKRLHGILRPFILRRLKLEVEKQLPDKVEHVVYCKLSKRQRNLYEDYVGSSEIQSTLSSGNYFGIFNVLMQLRKVCNHPDLFEGRPIHSAFDMPLISLHVPAISVVDMNYSLRERALCGGGFVFTNAAQMPTWAFEYVSRCKEAPSAFHAMGGAADEATPYCWLNKQSNHSSLVFKSIMTVQRRKQRWSKSRALLALAINEVRCSSPPPFGADLIETLRGMTRTVCPTSKEEEGDGDALVVSMESRIDGCRGMVEQFMFAVPRVRARQPQIWCSDAKGATQRAKLAADASDLGTHRMLVSEHLERIRFATVRQQLFFPDRRLVQYDCGKLQQLARLLMDLKSGGHRVLIFTQMSKMLDILESFLNLYNYTYFRLDGSTKPEQRQAYTQRFNSDDKIFAFILSTRSGGVGINLTGADTVVFYDSDWNPAMDHQAQDRCHRIGQTRTVHIYRLVCRHTIEENIMKKSNQKRHLDKLAIQSGEFDIRGFLTQSENRMDASTVKGAVLGATSSVASEEPPGKQEDADKESLLDELTEDGQGGEAAEGGEGAGGKGNEEESPAFDFSSLGDLLNGVDMYAIAFYEGLYPYDALAYVKTKDVPALEGGAGAGGAEGGSDGEDPDDVNLADDMDEEDLNVCYDWSERGAKTQYSK